jgi:hypothetical protein
MENETVVGSDLHDHASRDAVEVDFPLENEHYGSRGPLGMREPAIGGFRRQGDARQRQQQCDR